MKKLLSIALVCLAGCSVFAPKRADLMAACMADPDTKKAASAAGLSQEAFCEKLLSLDDPSSCDGGDSGSCKVRPTAPAS